MRNPNWTAREDGIAASLRAKGLDYVLIGDRLNRTAYAVKRRLGWMKLSVERRAEIGRTRSRNRDGEARA